MFTAVWGDGELFIFGELISVGCIAMKIILNRCLSYAIVLCMALMFQVGTVGGSDKVIKMSTTTSTENSGLLNVLLPAFTNDTGIQVKVFAKGTGAAVRDGMEGDVDIIFVHEREREDRFIAEGYGSYRLGVMHNDFVIVGPSGDPAQVKGLRDPVSVLKRIGDSGANFVSRGDDSGTHAVEQKLWRGTGIVLVKESRAVVEDGKRREVAFFHPGRIGLWYFSIGQGMGKTLTFAEEKQAYALSDRATYLHYKFGRKQELNLEIVCEGDSRLFNAYAIIPVSPKKHPHVKFEWADGFAKWLVSQQAQALIANYKIHGQQAFFPEAIPNAR
jgi:tungstate transport system substrate-binding protein